MRAPFAFAPDAAIKRAIREFRLSSEAEAARAYRAARGELTQSYLPPRNFIDHFSKA